jgi:hypothetical protein
MVRCRQKCRMRRKEVSLFLVDATFAPSLTCELENHDKKGAVRAFHLRYANLLLPQIPHLHPNILHSFSQRISRFGPLLHSCRAVRHVIRTTQGDKSWSFIPDVAVSESWNHAVRRNKGVSLFRHLHAPCFDFRDIS